MCYVAGIASHAYIIGSRRKEYIETTGDCVSLLGRLLGSSNVVVRNFY